MNLRRALFIAALVAPWAAWPAAGQTPFPPAGQTPFPPAGQTPFPAPQQQLQTMPRQQLQTMPQQQFQQPQQQQQQQEPPCIQQFVKLRNDAASKAKKIEAASKAKQKPSVQVACRLFRSFSSAEAKLIKYAVENRTGCGIPEQVIDQMKKSHSRTNQTRSRVCQAAAAPARPRGPSLSDALGNDVPNAGNIKSGHGTFDTLTGTPLGQR
jgi:hypothetical protein